MKTLAVISMFSSLVVLNATVQADEGGSVAPVPATTCYKLEQANDACVVVGPTIIEYNQPRLEVIDLNGAWGDGGNAQPYIYFYADSQYAAGYTIHIDMSLMNRPDAFGYMSDANTISVVFPDDRDYTGKIENGNTIRWSNNSVWTKR